jgi:pyruvate kinase
MDEILTALTPQDIEDLSFIAQHPEFDAVAVSFVSSKADIDEAIHVLKTNGQARPIVAKIETLKGVEKIEEIMESAAQIMVGRGDLALTSPWERMPALVDAIVDACAIRGVPWIMATQVAEGLQFFDLMTRAEMCDLWHWTKRGCSAVLLSRETAWGPKPVATVSNVAKLIKAHRPA